MKGELQGENLNVDEVKTTLREYLEKACILRDPYALEAKLKIHLTGLYGYPKDIPAMVKISDKERALGGMPICADILYFKCQEPWPLKKIMKIEVRLEESRLDANTVRVLRGMGQTTTLQITQVVDDEKNYQAVEEGVRNSDVKFLNLKLRFILEGVGGYKKDYEAARLLLIKPYADSYDIKLDKTH